VVDSNGKTVPAIVLATLNPSNLDKIDTVKSVQPIFENYTQEQSYVDHTSCGFILRGEQNPLLAFSEDKDPYDPIRTNPATTPKYAAEVDRLRRLLYKASGYYELGDYDNAIIDPYNQAARRGQQRVHSERRDYYRAAYDETRSRLLTEVDRSWEIAPDTFANRNTQVGSSSFERSILIQRKLRTIIIPRIDFENTTLEAAITQLSQAIRDNDPEPNQADKGVSFVIRRLEILPTVDGGTIEHAPIRIKQLSLRDVPAEEVVKQLCALSSPRMSFRVETYVVAIEEATASLGQSMQSRSYYVPPYFIERIGGVKYGN